MIDWAAMLRVNSELEHVRSGVTGLSTWWLQANEVVNMSIAVCAEFVAPDY